ncbi:hypothetical protein AMATHDRAFT_38056 [Amanita thiersii Skay4041]|uniref:UBC core domain-containing protein n=1 Tax=Amanita thiersii Skay4041 TaxID=703135 RepID=A0A2A9P0X6_9AGAR|nr:hypothetical protein AMATHDRAFT_38056 [Amanita thiersii Skay4041]
MPSPDKSAPAKQDIVQRIASPHSYAIVLRCWHDAEDVPPNPLDPLMRPLKRGEVGVSFLANGGEREILPESALRLVDRTLNPGDYCKRNVDNVHSGVVTNLHVRGRLEHAITSEKIDHYWTAQDLDRKADAEIGDHVIYDDWIGQVIEVFDESLVEVTNGQLVRVPELGSRLNVGEKGPDILPPPTSSIHSLFGFLLGGHRPNSSDTVVAVKHTVYAVAWLALNQSASLRLPAVIAEAKRRPQRFWSGKDISRLTLVRGRSDLEMRVGDRVHLKDRIGKPSSRHGQDTDNLSAVTVQTFVVTETETVLDVLWQDGSRQALKATDVIPYLNPDEYDCWPGDHVLWKNEDRKQSAIVQSVNAADRTAVILLTEDESTEIVSVLELDPHGTSDQGVTMAQSMADSFGVRRSDFVFVHPENSTNGFDTPYVPRIGELESWVHETPFLDYHLSGWRKEMSEIGNRIAAQSPLHSLEGELMIIPEPGDNNLTWIGEVTGLNLDGTVEVTHPDLTVKTYPLNRLTRLYDGIEQLEDQAWADESSNGHASYLEEDEEIWALNEDGTWEQDHSNDPEWIDEDGADAQDNMDIVNCSRNNERNLTSSEPGVSLCPKISAPPPVETRSSSMDATITSTDAQMLDEHESQMDAGEASHILAHGNEESWKRFDILASAPPDHAFFSSTPATPSKVFLNRLYKEYRALASSLPESIIVRAFEDRTDLLRSLIIGPENTPYENAPFVIDWMLDSNFPYSPPIAYFFSWTNGNGRVNPNLYEEGKVCLSILGTWAGDRNETWSAARSSLLQAFVSIQGLVLVKEPWFCEPAYDKLRGTEEGIVNSRLYSEKAYVLSRGFVRRALEIPLGGLEPEIKWLYFTRGRLEKVLQDARKLIEKSRSCPQVNEQEHEAAVPRLSTGGIITLERTLVKLQSLLEVHRNDTTR